MLNKKMDCKCNGPFVVGEALSVGRSYIIERHEKWLNIHFSYLKLWLDTPPFPYLREYFKRQKSMNKTPILKETLQYLRLTRERESLKFERENSVLSAFDEKGVYLLPYERTQ